MCVIKDLKESRSVEPIKKLKKENLAKVRISHSCQCKKSHILDLIKDYCFKNEIIDEVEEKLTVKTADVLRIKLEFEHEEQRLACKEAQRACEAFEAEAQKACEEAQKVMMPRKHCRMHNLLANVKLEI